MAGDDEALRMLLVVLLIRFFPICDAGQNGSKESAAGKVHLVFHILGPPFRHHNILKSPSIRQPSSGGLSCKFFSTPHRKHTKAISLGELHLSQLHRRPGTINELREAKPTMDNQSRGKYGLMSGRGIWRALGVGGRVKNKRRRNATAVESGRRQGASPMDVQAVGPGRGGTRRTRSPTGPSGGGG